MTVGVLWRLSQTGGRRAQQESPRGINILGPFCNPPAFCRFLVVPVSDRVVVRPEDISGRGRARRSTEVASGLPAPTTTMTTVCLFAMSSGDSGGHSG